MGRLCRRQRAWASLRDPGLDPCEADRGNLQRHLGDRGATERHGGRRLPALALVTIPAIGIVHGEIFYLKELAEDCAADGVYEFFFCAPPLVITRGTGSPINPQAIK